MTVRHRGPRLSQRSRLSHRSRRSQRSRSVSMRTPPGPIRMDCAEASGTVKLPARRMKLAAIAARRAFIRFPPKSPQSDNVSPADPSLSRPVMKSPARLRPVGLRPHARAILADAPALLLELALRGCCLKRTTRQPFFLILLGIEPGEVLTDVFVCSVTFEALCPRVPRILSARTRAECEPGSDASRTGLCILRRETVSRRRRRAVLKRGNRAPARRQRRKPLETAALSL